MTFVAGLIPVVGKLISNVVVVVVSLSVSPYAALGSLTYLVAIFLNARLGPVNTIAARRRRGRS